MNKDFQYLVLLVSPPTYTVQKNDQTQLREKEKREHACLKSTVEAGMDSPYL
jgi:hypothetical protein